ncbi:Cyclin, N-terminal domain [Carpediemonas membranifera]|uniref:Cyclin, N-terminal domain n=1 Tax=Carpediemonas membranifera TaxID=201153 RepID=A0A8J6EBL0_9EUKA|nr:Cyclin, N-terminal domain [Carpediemonas membranifera]|eukprot:KAG9397585.1 Cyclin, N-terminal domain [Carpediemonas membranifera]
MSVFETAWERAQSTSNPGNSRNSQLKSSQLDPGASLSSNNFSSVLKAIADREARISELQQQIQAVKPKISKAGREIRIYEAELTNLSNQKAALWSKFEEKQAPFTKGKEDLDALEEQVESMRQECTSTNAGAAGLLSMQAMIQRHQETAKQLIAENGELTVELQDLIKQREAVVDKAAAMREELHARLAVLEETEAHTEDMRKATVRAVDEREKTARRIFELQREVELSSAHDEAARVTEDVQTMQELCNNTQASVVAARRCLVDAKNKQCAVLAESKKTIGEAKGNLKKAFEGLQESKKELETAASVLSQDYQARQRQLKGMLTQAESEASRLSASIEQAQAKLEGTNQEIAKVKTELSKAHATRRMVLEREAAVRSLQERKDTLAAQLSRANEQIRETIGEEMETNQLIRGLEEEIEELRAECDKIQEALDSACSGKIWTSEIDSALIQSILDELG